MNTALSARFLTARSALREDLKCNDDSFGRLAVVLFRASQALGPLGKVPNLVLRVVCGTDLPAVVVAGPGLRLPHGGRGLVVHSDTVIGPHVTLLHGVTVGVTAAGQAAPPSRGGRLRRRGGMHPRNDHVGRELQGGRQQRRAD